jgi:hypothetical protein
MKSYLIAKVFPVCADDLRFHFKHYLAGGRDYYYCSSGDDEDYFFYLIFSQNDRKECVGG